MPPAMCPLRSMTALSMTMTDRPLLPGGEGRVEAAHAAADDQYVRLMTMGLHRNGSLFLEVVQEGADTARALGAVFRAGGVGNADMAFAGRAEVVAGHAGHKLLLKGGACRTSPSRGLCRGGR